MTTGPDGTASTAVPNIVEDGGSVTLYVKETKAPAGCTPLASPYRGVREVHQARRVRRDRAGPAPQL